MNFNFAKITKCPLVFCQIIIVELCRIIYNQKKRKKEEEEIANCYHSISICDDARNVERVFASGLKQGILLLFGKQKQPRKKWNHFTSLIETKVILLFLFLFCLRASSQLCRIIY